MCSKVFASLTLSYWIPAFAGMTEWVFLRRSPHQNGNDARVNDARFFAKPAFAGMT
uniref:Uncharacterized protein n=1 Tax=Candidatus Kentrum sp. UNK TaxID=2126344 RepID=A0A451ACR4_9GAMM|nr:MAG: hypothetical protein BECKUNK1418G_GA0071005_10387 [Candidatus Kentron sp. UNK]VFK70946.1 MAG: hypothetical protein BECKUNK1418H_GA0071006_10447 [Candidatus Kentron sp. UNK]